MVITITNHSTLAPFRLYPQEIGLNITGQAICHSNVTIGPASPSEIKQTGQPHAATVVTSGYTKCEPRFKNIISFRRAPSVDTSPFKLKFVYIRVTNSVRTAMKTPRFTVTKINWLTLFKEIIAG
jgi:hypothetical protein